MVMICIDTDRGGAMATVGEQLAKLRTDQGLSQNGFAKLIGKSVGYVRLVETDERALSNPDTITSWADALDIEEDKLYAILGRIPPDIVDALTTGNPDVFATVRRCLNPTRRDP